MAQGFFQQHFERSIRRHDRRRPFDGPRSNRRLVARLLQRTLRKRVAFDLPVARRTVGNGYCLRGRTAYRRRRRASQLTLLFAADHNAIAREHELSITVTADCDDAIVVQLVVATTKRSEVSRGVVASMRSMLEVMNIEIARGPAAREATPILITFEDVPTH